MIRNIKTLSKLGRRYGSHGKDWANHELEVSDKPIIKVNIENKYVHALGLNTEINDKNEFISKLIREQKQRSFSL